ncbi:MAG: hypothetical protein ACE5GA_09130, partial [Candidatus Zixiibacteriota bacterium]
MSEPAGYHVSAVYFGSVYFALHFAEGHIPFTHFCFLPWVGYFWIRSVEKRKFVIHAATALALMILGNGAAAPTLYTATFLGLLGVFFCVQRRSGAPLANLALVGAFGVGLSAVKFVPMLVFLASNPWIGSPGDVTPLAALPAAFFSFNQGLFSHIDLNLPWGWHEYGAYLSPLAVILALWRLLRGARESNRTRRFKVNRAWAALALIFLILGLGGFADWSPWSLLSELPGFASSRSPGRAFQFVLLAVGVLAGFGFDDLRAYLAEKRFSRKPALAVTVGVFILIAGVNYILALQSLSQSFTRTPVAAEWSDEFQQSLGGKLDMYRAVRENRGALAASRLSAYQENRGLLTPSGEILPEYVLSGKMTVESRSYRGGRIEYSINAETDGEVILGMGYDDGWTIDSPQGWTLREEQGLLAVRFPVGENSFELVYRPPYFWIGAGISVVALLGALLFYRRFSAA